MKLAIRSALSVHGSIAIKFSFAMLPFILPANVFRPWIQAESQSAYEAWRLSLKSQLDAIFKGGPPSGVILCFIDIPLFWGHFVVIDLMAGIR